MTLGEYMRQAAARTDEALERWVPAGSVEPVTLHTAMRYSLFAGGKRIRPVLCITAAEAVDPGRDGAALGVENAACTLEMIHTYSLIHDDLPAMDNDDYRRGRLTCHKVFGDAMAILAGDALLTLAFEVLSKIDGVDDSRKIRMVRELSSGSGCDGGMVAGQVHDIEGEGKPPDAALLEQIHRAKTGALLKASVRMGAIYAGADAEQLEAVSQYGEHIGFAFQIVDDILDVEQPSEKLGKTAGKDAAQKKITFPAVYGLAESKRMAIAELARAHESLRIFGGRAHWLGELANLIVNRTA